LTTSSFLSNPIELALRRSPILLQWPTGARPPLSRCAGLRPLLSYTLRSRRRMGAWRSCRVQQEIDCRIHDGRTVVADVEPILDRERARDTIGRSQYPQFIRADGVVWQYSNAQTIFHRGLQSRDALACECHPVLAAEACQCINHSPTPHAFGIESHEVEWTLLVQLIVWRAHPLELDVPGYQRIDCHNGCRREHDVQLVFLPQPTEWDAVIDGEIKADIRMCTTKPPESDRERGSGNLLGQANADAAAEICLS